MGYIFPRTHTVPVGQLLDCLSVYSYQQPPYLTYTVALEECFQMLFAGSLSSTGKVEFFCKCAKQLDVT